MHRRTFLRNTAFTFGALTISQQKILAALVDDPWKVKMIRGDVGIFTERGGTIGFLLGRDGNVVIDSQFPDTAQHCINDLKKRSDKPFRYLINTHHHGDHSGGNIAFKGLAQHVVAHQNSLLNQQRVAQTNKTEEKQLYPDTTYTDKWKARVGKEKIRMFYYGAGHTNGDSIIYFDKANIAHMGDLMFNRRHPFVDKTAGANMQNWMQILDKAAGKFERDTIYIFGHAAEGHEVTGTRDDLMKFKEYLGRVLDFARQQHGAGTTKEDFLKKTEIPGVTEWKGDGIQRPLAAAWEEVVSGK
jgi:glyoxylase-like metal-dependent hydrolase (beta-lactamase superfamily II)